ncbi:MAG: hypothetical protein SFY81_04775 [Verrucomicrobiota bacterium]|nr:hypothetical protein [Verrucomicrobiota bacterium]
MTRPATVQECLGAIYLAPNGKLVLRPHSGRSLPIPASSFASLQHLKDGSFLLVPEDNWISIHEAARILNVSHLSAWRLTRRCFPDSRRPLLASRRSGPGARSLQVSLSSLRQFLAFRSDPNSCPPPKKNKLIISC